MSWAEAAREPLAGMTCLWQDLDGLHVEAAPAQAPPTSILWGWDAGTRMARVRLDGQTAYVDVCDASKETLVAAHPWNVDQDGGDRRVAASRGRGPAKESGGAGAEYEQVVTGHAAPVTFIRPVSAGGAGE